MKFAFIFLTAVLARGQQLDLSSLDKLADKAKESSVITLDPDKLRLASGMFSGDSADQRKLQGLMSKMKAVYVRSLEFENPGAFTQADLEPVRKQLRAPGWSKIIDVKEKDERTEIYFFKEGDNGGFAIVSAEKNELTVVNIIGMLDLSTLGNLGALGIPGLNTGGGGGAGTAGRKPATTPRRTSPETQDEDDN